MAIPIINGDGPDGEHFVDTPIKPIPTADTWESLSVNQLLEIQSGLQTRRWEFRNQAVMVKALDVGLNRLQALISQKLSES